MFKPSESTTNRFSGVANKTKYLKAKLFLKKMSDSGEVATVITVIRAAIFTVNILGNALILLVVRYSKYFSHLTRHLVVHVAVTGILFGCIIVMQIFFSTWLLMWTSYICIIVQSIVLATSACSGFGICLILVENYVSTSSQLPRRYTYVPA